MVALVCHSFIYANKWRVEEEDWEEEEEDEKGGERGHREEMKRTPEVKPGEGQWGSRNV